MLLKIQNFKIMEYMWTYESTTQERFEHVGQPQKCFCTTDPVPCAFSACPPRWINTHLLCSYGSSSQKNLFSKEQTVNISGCVGHTAPHYSYSKKVPLYST